MNISHHVNIIFRIARKFLINVMRIIDNVINKYHSAEYDGMTLLFLGYILSNYNQHYHSVDLYCETLMNFDPIIFELLILTFGIKNINVIAFNFYKFFENDFVKIMHTILLTFLVIVRIIIIYVIITEVNFSNLVILLIFDNLLAIKMQIRWAIKRTINDDTINDSSDDNELNVNFNEYYQIIKNNELIELKPSCPICYNTNISESDYVMINKCQHAFHLICLDKWLYHSQERDITLHCPICRFELSS
jgi:hypothetical protein